MKPGVIKFIAIILFFNSGMLRGNAQSVIAGKVINGEQKPISSANVRVKELNKGAVTDSFGNFSLTVTERGKRSLEVSSIGYTTRVLDIELTGAADSAVHIEIVLQNEAKTLGEVRVSAGSFEASDKAKGASLTPIDAVTVAGNNGDIANALRSLPGAQQIGEIEGLFVRGGTGEETKQFVDGTWLKNPNWPTVPGVPQGARLNPFLFKGILFSTGGYSALYGQALSSALILESVDLPEQSSAALHIFPQSMGAGFQRLSRKQNASYGINSAYSNLGSFYYKIVPQKPDFFHGPEYLKTDGNFRIQTSKTGMLKFYTNYGYSNVGMKFPDVDSTDLFSSFGTKGTNWYNNFSYRESLRNRWKIDAATSYNYYRDKITRKLLNDQGVQIFLPHFPYDEKNATVETKSNFTQERIVISKPFSRNQALRFGAEHFYTLDKFRSIDSAVTLNDNLFAAFLEADLRISSAMAVRVGVRSEHSSLLKQFILAPRISIAYKLNEGGQVNMAYGVFYQKPENIWLLETRDLDFIRATHYLVNYQKKAGNRLFRIEAYYKEYKNLVITEPEVNNNGSGYAKGIEVFWRDKKTFKGLDYWVSYTYLDTKRKFLDYPSTLRPTFTTPHTASVAVKRFFQEINLSANLSYFLATGRPYYDIRNDISGKPAIYDRGTTNAYNAVNLSFAYLFSMFNNWKNKDFSGIGFGINNVFGTKQVFGYRYSYNGLNKVPITQPAVRSYYLGIFMSLGIDRRDDFINEKL